MAEIEIRKSANGAWEAWVGGGMFEWSNSLPQLLKTLFIQADEIEEEVSHGH